jgi:hypothetical protein
MGFETQGSATERRSELDASKKAGKLFQENIKITQQLQGSLPTNRELINKIHRYGLQKI